MYIYYISCCFSHISDHGVHLYILLQESVVLLTTVAAKTFSPGEQTLN